MEVETLRASSVASEGLFTELKTTIMRVEDLQAQAVCCDSVSNFHRFPEEPAPLNSKTGLWAIGA